MRQPAATHPVTRKTGKPRLRNEAGFPPRTHVSPLGGSIAQNPHHRPVALLFGEQPGIILVVTFVAVDDDVLRRRDQAMLNAAVAADGFLIGPRVEKTDILRSSPQFRQKDRIRVRLPVVIVLAVAGQPSEENPLVLAVPVIDGEQNVPLVDPPDVGQRRS